MFYKKCIKEIYKKLETLNETPMDGEKILKMERRLQMLMALILFTPTVLSAIGSDAFQQNKSTLTWGIFVAIYIGVYIYCEACGVKLNRLSANVIDLLVWVHLTAFIPFFIIIGAYQDIISGVPLFVFAITSVVVFWLPVVVILSLGFTLALGGFFSFVKVVRRSDK